MTDKTRIVSARVPNEVADWLESEDVSHREILETQYKNRFVAVDLWRFKRACDRLKIDYQLAIDRMTEEINAIPMPKGR